MIIIDNVLVSEMLIEECFCCDIAQCQGSCCIEGDTGAPLDPLEISDLENYYPDYKKYLTQNGIHKLEEEGLFDYDAEGNFVTPLLEDEACAYICYDNGIAHCAIEKAFRNGEIEFQKPISCHLYPIRILQLPDYEALNYHRWFVCTPAVIRGKSLNLPVYQFLKEPLLRKYGEDWFRKLEKSVKNCR
ncbi:MAG: DUF3109 family protein [Bacteroidales bacterium]|jgi:hypothetical protein|nr:DUF3109 family protein [Bacteroidales bacterium]